MYGFCIARSISDGVIDKPMDNINIPSAYCISDKDIVDPIKDGFFIANPAAIIVHRGDNAQNLLETSANDILLSHIDYYQMTYVYYYCAQTFVS